MISAKLGERSFRVEIPYSSPDAQDETETPTVVISVPGNDLSEGFV